MSVKCCTHRLFWSVRATYSITMSLCLKKCKIDSIILLEQYAFSQDPTSLWLRKASMPLLLYLPTITIFKPHIIIKDKFCKNIIFSLKIQNPTREFHAFQAPPRKNGKTKEKKPILNLKKWRFQWINERIGIEKGERKRIPERKRSAAEELTEGGFLEAAERRIFNRRSRRRRRQLKRERRRRRWRGLLHNWVL